DYYCNSWDSSGTQPVF
nr:immunoglobulin light chain junction region [Macaca mulatta]MOW69834.1 immunoglobulin light chain junction region [Macaca mulatta]MOW71562.1 immunoglobulin light chain junction region [Macaca mulatta]